jgi:hypothetical protein
MKCAKLLVVICILALTANAFAQDDCDGFPLSYSRIYVKGECSAGPINSPLCEDRNLTDPDSPDYWDNGYGGMHKEFLFYDGAMHIMATGKVGFTGTIWASGNACTDCCLKPPYDCRGQKGTVIVEGHLFGNYLRPWKNGCPMELYVMDGGLLELNLLDVGHWDGFPDPAGEFYLMGGLAILEDMGIRAGTKTPSFIDITGGELLINNSNWSVADVEAAIAAGDIFNSNAYEGYVIEVTTKDVGGALYTSVTLGFDPLAGAVGLIGEAIGEKDNASEVLGDAIAMEKTAKGLLEDVLAGLDPDDPNYEDVEDAKAATNSAIVGERAAQRKINKTAGKLENALELLGAGDGGEGPKPPK